MNLLLRIVTIPAALIHGLVLFIRHALFDTGILRSAPGSVRTIVIGNLAAGGTGKTPHTEYVARILQRQGVAFGILSRGYRRTSRGFMELTVQTPAGESGDEPLQMKRKFPMVPVAVCADRREGILRLRALHPALQLVLLDDAFQHRRLRPDCSILLTTLNRPYWKDHLLPWGYLRDLRKEKKRANCIVVSKCYDGLKSEAMKEVSKAVDPGPEQQVFFSKEILLDAVHHSGPIRDAASVTHWIGFAGIASTTSFQKHLEEKYFIKKFIKFPDHHRFSEVNVTQLRNELSTFAGLSAALVTTEKDAMRLGEVRGFKDVPIFYVPMKVEIMDGQERFEQLVLSVATTDHPGKKDELNKD